ncbi:MAG: hypothetical protein K2H29_06340 [Oscillospiraceae bacterium]|nr:hypothetical protein [Oscillospiraceae bacterium]
MNQKHIEKLLHFVDEQTLKQIAENYEVTDSKTKEKIYQKICEKKRAMHQESETISETYHTPYVKFVSCTKTFGIATVCMLITVGTIGGIWKLTRIGSPSENVNSIIESNTDTLSLTQTETTTTTQLEPIATRPAYLTAYLEICEQNEKDFNNSIYCLYDIDKDGTPELIIEAPSAYTTSPTSLYTYADNQVYVLMDKCFFDMRSQYMIHGDHLLGYLIHPDNNSIYYNIGEYSGLIYHYVYQTITPQHTLEKVVLTRVTDVDTLFKEYPYLKEDDSYNYINGNGYYINYEKTTEEEYNAFYSAHNPETYSKNVLDYKSYSEFLESLPE